MLLHSIPTVTNSTDIRMENAHTSKIVCHFYLEKNNSVNDNHNLF